MNKQLIYGLVEMYYPILDSLDEVKKVLLVIRRTFTKELLASDCLSYGFNFHTWGPCFSILNSDPRPISFHRLLQ